MYIHIHIDLFLFFSIIDIYKKRQIKNPTKNFQTLGTIVPR